MGPGLVVVGDVGAEHVLEVSAAEYEHPVQALGSDRADPPLRERVRAGSRIGVLMIRTPSERKTSSERTGDLRSRSRITNRIPRSRSPTAR